MLKEFLSTLCELDGVSGHEETVRRYILDQLDRSDTPKEVQVDAMGNVLVHLIGKEPAAKVVQFDAHMDEVGVIITHINGDGTLRFEKIGGIMDEVLFGRRVRIGQLRGIIGGKAVHQCTPEAKKSVPSADGLVIDIGAADKQSAEKLVRVGEVGTFDRGLTFLQEDVFCGKAVDDRLGCALLLGLAQKQPCRDIWLSFSVQEELGCRGASAATEAIHPDIGIAVETTTAADIPGNSGDAVVCCLGKGAVVSFADRATLYDPTLYEQIRSLADQNGIPTQTKSRVAGGNNAGAIQRSHTGVRTAAVSLPCRYIHSPACMGRMTDVQAMMKLIELLAEELTR